MDYERAYNDALERAKKLAHDNAWVTSIFPELKESEDEKIRKKLYHTVLGTSDTDEWFEDISKDKVLAYLEKQKEQKPLMYDGEIEDKKRDIVAAIRKYYPADYAEYLTSFLKGLSPEDNSEDEYGQEMLGIAYKLMYEHIPENLRTQEFWDSLKFMREYTGKVAIIHSYEQPAEWSEEDENKLYQVMEVLLADKTIALRDNPHCKALHRAYDELLDWLKSLRPRPHWKPSKEQMKAIDLAIRFVTDDFDEHPTLSETLRGLYNVLKKL